MNRYSHSLVIQDGFFDRNSDVEKALSSLQKTIDCQIISSSTSSPRNDERKLILEMKKFAKEQLMDLKTYLKK